MLILGFTIRQSKAYNSIGDWLKPQIEFKTEIYDFDKLDSASNASYYFHYKNTGKSKLQITDISTACGCTVVDWNPMTLGPGESDSLLITYDTHLMGYFTREIVINSNSKTSPDRIYIKGMVERANNSD